VWARPGPAQTLHETLRGAQQRPAQTLHETLRSAQQRLAQTLHETRDGCGAFQGRLRRCDKRFMKLYAALNSALHKRFMKLSAALNSACTNAS
jgi:hypothetical protein